MPSSGEVVSPSPPGLDDSLEHLVQEGRRRPVFEVTEHFGPQVKQQLCEHKTHLSLRVNVEDNVASIDTPNAKKASEFQLGMRLVVATTTAHESNIRDQTYLPVSSITMWKRQ